MKFQRKLNFLDWKIKTAERVCKRDLVPPERGQTGFSQPSAIDLAPGMGC